MVLPPLGLLLAFLSPLAPVSAQNETAVGRPELVFQVGHSTGMTALAISHDSRLFASGGHDNSIRLWDLRTGFEIRSCGMLPDEVRDAAFSMDGSFIGAFCNKLAVVWDVRSGKE